MNVKTGKVMKITALMIVVALVASLVTYNYTIAGFQGAQESLPFYLGAPQPYGYIVDTNGTYFLAYNGTTGYLESESTNSTTLFSNAIGNCSSGQSIFIRNGTYGPIFLNKDVSLIGEGLSTTPAAYPSDPDDMITGMSGVVIRITTANTNALTINGTRGNICIENIGIHFTGSGTGNGVYSPAAHDQSGLMYSTMRNIVVWGHDANHYAFYLVNFQHCVFSLFLSFGGPAFHLQTDSSTLTYGISEFGLTYSRVPSTISTMTHNVYEFIGTTGGKIGGLKFDRVHIMDRSGANTASSLYIENGYVIDIRELDIENPMKKMVTMLNCSYITTFSAFMFGGGVSHTGCIFCGYQYGYIDPTWSGTNLGALTDSGTDFIGSGVSLPTSVNVTFSRSNHMSCSYRVYMIGTLYYATDGSTGQNTIWGSNAEYVFATVESVMPTGGGLISIGPADYAFSNTFYVNKTGITFQGETSNNGVVRFILVDGKNVPLLNITADYTTFRDITINGNNWGQNNSTDTVVIKANNCLFERVTVTRGPRYLVSMTGGDHNVFRDSDFAYSYKGGFYIDGGTSYAIIDSCQISDIGSGTQFTDVAGVYLGWCIGGAIINSQFHYIDSAVGATHYGYGIEELSGASTNMQYITNSGYACAQGLFATIQSTSSVQENNVYYHSDTVGASEPSTGAFEHTVLNIANTTATTFVFASGTSGTPDSVNVQFNFTGWTSWTWTAVGTQVTVTITGTLPAAMKILAADCKYIP
jgi:hypothetical protein